MADRGATASAKVLHEASLSQASAGPQLETTAQTGTLPEERALGEPEMSFASSQHTGHVCSELPQCAAQPRLHRRNVQLTAEWTSCFLKWITSLFYLLFACLVTGSKLKPGVTEQHPSEPR